MESRSQEIFELYRNASPGEDAAALLEDLLVNHAEPLIRRSVERRLSRLYQAADAADLVHEAMAELLARLHALRREPQPEPFNFDALATRAAANTVHRYWGRLFPEWARLRKRLRYFVETDRGVRLWRNQRGELICAPAGASDSDGVADAREIASCREAVAEAGAAGKSAGEAARATLERLGRGIAFTALVAAVAGLLGVRDAPPEAGPSAADAPDPAPGAAERIEWRERMEALWREIRDLPPRQRAALLLGLRAAHGAALWGMADLGVARFGELAESLEMTPPELAELWNRLPLEDLEIAARLGTERQQVINLRQAARQRLARRVRAAAVPMRERNRS